MEYLSIQLRKYLSSVYGIRPFGMSGDIEPNTYGVLDSRESLLALNVECPKLFHLLEMTSVEKMNLLVKLILDRDEDTGEFRVISEPTHPDSLVLNDILCGSDVILKTKTRVIREDTEGLIKELRQIENRASEILIKSAELGL